MSEKKPLLPMQFLKQDSVAKRFEEILGDRAPQFVSTVLQLVNQSKLLKAADPQTVMTAAATAAVLNLPLNKNLGYAFIIPYVENKGREGERVVAQFQMGWKGYVQLAHRSRQYAKLNALVIYKSQFISWDPLTETLDADMMQEPCGNIAGFAAMFETTSGFKKILFWTNHKVRTHAQKYSKSFGKSGSGWTTNYEAMGLKTLVIQILTKWGPMSTQMQKASLADESVQLQEGEFEYIDKKDDPGLDPGKVDADKQKMRLLAEIERCVNELDEQALDDIYQACEDAGIETEHHNALLTVQDRKKNGKKKK